MGDALGRAAKVKRGLVSRHTGKERSEGNETHDETVVWTANNGRTEASVVVTFVETESD